MAGKKDVLAKARLYLVLDRQVCSYSKLFEILKQAVGSGDAGVDVIQLRDKVSSSREIMKFAQAAVTCLKGKIPFIINDRVDLAIASGAAGVHLGQDDMPIADARRMMGKQAIIGISCQTLAHARQAQKQGADYIGWGSVFSTLTKPDRRPMDVRKLAQDIRKIKIPVFVIGGIDRQNLTRLRNFGIQRVAVCRDICLARSIAQSVREFKKGLK